MLGDMNEQMRNASHAVLRDAVEQIFNQYFTEEVLGQLNQKDLNLLSDALTHRLTREVENAVLYRKTRLISEKAVPAK